MNDGVRDARPPHAVIVVLNPVMRALLRTPAARLLPALALIELTGRHSGRSLSVVVGLHAIDGTDVIFTPARWRANFTGGALAVLRHRGRRSDRIGTLIEEPSEVAAALNATIGTGTSPRALGLRVPPGHTITPADVQAVRRAMVRFGPVTP